MVTALHYNDLVPGFVAILEDNPVRIAEMRACLAEALPAASGIVFENAFEMIEWLNDHLGEVMLISLDHDLPLPGVDGRTIACGGGRMVADFLASRAPTCPVIVHSSNDYCAPGMFFALEEAGWPTARVVPYEGHQWVRGVWKPQVVKYLRDGWIAP